MEKQRVDDDHPDREDLVQQFIAQTYQLETAMRNSETFDGFPSETFIFLRQLEKNNDRAWFSARRDVVERALTTPAQEFVAAFGEGARQIYPRLVYDVRTNGMGSLFRLSRDTRFSSDKTPYKTNLGFRFWLSEEARDAKRVGLYVHLDKSGVRVYGGAHQLSPEDLAAFRSHVGVDSRAADLRRILTVLAERGYELEAEQLLRPPRGYPTDHPNADVLVFKSLCAYSPKIDPDAAQSSRLVGECLAHAAALRDLNVWFTEAIPAPSPVAR